MLSKTLKTALILTLSSCAGSPPKLERPVKLYSGSPSRQAMCRRTKESLAKFVKSNAQHTNTKNYARQVINQIIAEDGIECVKADSQAFGAMVGIPADDLRVLLQYQENLLYKCEKWAK